MFEEYPDLHVAMALRSVVTRVKSKGVNYDAVLHVSSLVLFCSHVACSLQSVHLNEGLVSSFVCPLVTRSQLALASMNVLFHHSCLCLED